MPRLSPGFQTVSLRAAGWHLSPQREGISPQPFSALQAHKCQERLPQDSKDPLGGISHAGQELAENSVLELLFLLIFAGMLKLQVGQGG